MKDVFLFVYGTLRRGTENQMYHVLAQNAEFIGEATYQGELYRVGKYPGAVPSVDSSDTIYGEVYRLPDPEPVLSRLDEYEGCGPGCTEPTAYVRRTQHVRLRSGASLAAWVYLYNRPTDDLERLYSGDFSRIRVD